MEDDFDLFVCECVYSKYRLFMKKEDGVCLLKTVYRGACCAFVFVFPTAQLKLNTLFSNSQERARVPEQHACEQVLHMQMVGG